jgi:hypothetical protein
MMQYPQAFYDDWAAQGAEMLRHLPEDELPDDAEWTVLAGRVVVRWVLPPLGSGKVRPGGAVR